MYRDRIEYLKREIKRTYKRYTGERTDGKATLLNVVELFNISIDSSRLDDYVVKNINFLVPSIELYDTKNNVTYYAEYTSRADLLQSYGVEVKYINVIINGIDYRVESLHWIDDTNPIITKLTFKNGEYNLSFTGERANNINLCSTDGLEFSVRYSKNVENRRGKEVEAKLLTKRLKKDGRYTKHFEHLYTYDDSFYIIREGMQEKYIYIYDDCIIYGIGDIDQKDLCHHFRGICFEDMTKDVENYLPLNMRISNSSKLFDKNVQSAMVFSGWTEENKRHFLDIYKYNDTISINYQESDITQQPSQITNRNLNIPIFGNGKITKEEIAQIISTLEFELPNNGFMMVVIHELREYLSKIANRNGILSKDDLLSPKLLIDKSFAEIFDLVASNKEEYFKLANEQFKEAVKVIDVNKRPQVKAIKPLNIK